MIPVAVQLEASTCAIACTNCSTSTVAAPEKAEATVVTTDGQLSIAGIPVFKSTAITADKFLVGDWSMGAQIMQRDGISVRFSEFDGNNFVENMITVRVEARIAFPIYYAGAFVYGDFGNVAQSQTNLKYMGQLKTTPFFMR